MKPSSPSPPGNSREAEDLASLLAFFRGLRGAALADYRALVEADRAFGEDVAAEAAAKGGAGAPKKEGA